MVKKRYHLTFSKEAVTQPIIWELGQTFRVITNIRRANVEEDVGWVVLEMEGEAGEVQRALEWLETKGVRVDPVERSVVE
jgi:ABC-type methionine transport system ATPase subunit